MGYSYEQAKGDAMKTQAIERLGQLKYRPTLYELVVTSPDHPTMLAGYGRHGQTGMLSLLRKNGEAWAKHMSNNDQVTFAKGGRSCQFGKLEFRFSGRTEREAIMEGPLPFFLREVTP